MTTRTTLMLVFLLKPSIARGELFVTVPEAACEAPALQPGAELLDARAPRWSAGGRSGPPGTGIAGAHVAVALRGARSGAQLTLTRFGTSYYDESRLAIGVGGTGANAMAITLDARRARIGEESRSGAGVGLAARVDLAGVALGLGVGPEARAGEERLFPSRFRIAAGLREHTRAARLVVTSRADAPPDVEIVVSWHAPRWHLATGLDLRRGALRVAVGLTTFVGVLVERTADPLTGDWTRAAVTAPRPRRRP